MKYAQAPKGFHTALTVVAWLGNGRVEHYAWSTPMALNMATHKAGRWTRESLRANKVRGRSTIVGLRIEAHYVKGRYRR